MRCNVWRYTRYFAVISLRISARISRSSAPPLPFPRRGRCQLACSGGPPLAHPPSHMLLDKAAASAGTALRGTGWLVMKGGSSLGGGCPHVSRSVAGITASGASAARELGWLCRELSSLRLAGVYVDVPARPYRGRHALCPPPLHALLPPPPRCPRRRRPDHIAVAVPRVRRLPLCHPFPWPPGLVGSPFLRWRPA